MTTDEKLDRLLSSVSEMKGALSLVNYRQTETDKRQDEHTLRMELIQEQIDKFNSDRNKIIGGATVLSLCLGAIGSFFTYLFTKN